PQSLKTIFSQDFENPLEVAKSGGTLTGNPVVRNGLFLDGTQYATYSVPNTLFYTPELSFIVDFTPDFEHDLNSIRSILGRESDVTFALVKWNDDTIRAQFGSSSGFSYFTIPGWVVGERQRLVYSARQGQQRMWLNGVLLGTSTGNFVPDFLTAAFTIGGTYSNEFEGIIHSVSVHSRYFTSEDITALQNNALYNFFNSSSVWLDFSSMANNVISDKSGKGRDFTNVGGDFSAPGMELNGSSDYIVNNSAQGIYGNDSQSIVMVFNPDFNWDADVYYYLFDSTSSNRYSVVKLINVSDHKLRVLLGDTIIEDIAASAYSAYWNYHGVNVLVIAGESGNTDVYLNGFKILDADNTAWAVRNPTEIYLGCQYNVTNRFDGEIFHFSAYPFKLSPIQAEFITSYMMSEN
ncbi:MAG: hypothetical protein KAS07_06155, partial [Candidatus Pacebacteria bacterium]|nr:hypothetical protein [Candidatus Paceibacterota bacterium]